MLKRFVALRGLLQPSRFCQATLSNQTNKKASMQEYQLYFKEELPKLESQSRCIIEELGKESPNIQRLKDLLGKYLTFDKGQFFPRTLKSLLNIGIAIEKSGCDSLSRYKYPLVQLINRVQLQGEKVNEAEMGYFIRVQANFRKAFSQKMKTSRLLFNLLVIVQHNFDAINPQLYLTVMKTLTTEISHQPRMVKVARLVQRHCVAFIRRINNKDPTLPPKIESIFTKSFLCILSEIYKTFGADSAQDFKVFYDFVESKIIRKYISNQIQVDFSYCNSLFRSFNFTLKNSNGQYYKKLLLKRITDIYLSTPKSIEAYAKSMHGWYLCSSILTYSFYTHAHTLTYLSQGSFQYLPRSQLAAKPTLPDVFWQIYKAYPQRINYVSYLQNTIRDVYPEQYIQTNGPSSPTIEPFLETQMKIRGQNALRKLGLSFKPELNISGRYIDFLIDEDVIIELDGIHHFNLDSLELTDKTQTRNLHLMYAGYRIITINIYEYNLARQIDEMKELILAKLTILKEKDAAIVL